MKKKLLVTVLLLSASLITMTACGKKDEPANTSSEEIQETEEKNTAEDAEKPEPDKNDTEGMEYEAATEKSIEEKLAAIWREDLPAPSGSQMVYDDLKNNAVTYFPNSFELKKPAESADTAEFINTTDGAEFTISAEDNKDGLTLEEFAEITAENEDISDSDLRYIGKYTFRLTGVYPEEEKCVKITGVAKNGKLYTMKLTYPEDLSTKYDMPENDVFMYVYNLDKDGNEVSYMK